MVKEYKIAAVNLTTVFEINSNGVPVRGLSFELVKLLSEKIGFRFKVVEPKDKIWGSKSDDGNWTGMMGMLQRKEADFTPTVTITPNRWATFDFSYPYDIDREVFYVAKPGLLSKDYVFTSPLNNNVWITFVLSLFVSAVVLKCLNKFNRLETKNRRYFFMDELHLFVVWTLGQGSFDKFKGSNVQLFLSFWIISKTALVLGYICVLLSFVMAPSYEKPIRTIPQLQKAILDGRYHLGVFRGTASYSNIMEANSSDYMKVFADDLKRNPQNAFTNVEKNWNRVTNEKYAMYTIERISSMYLYSRNEHRLLKSLDSIGLVPYGIAFRKGFKGINRFNNAIHRLVGAGLFQKLISKVKIQSRFILSKEMKRKSSASKSQSDVDSTFRPLEMSDISSIFKVLIASYVVSSFVLITENVCYYYNRYSHVGASRRCRCC